MTPGGRFTPGGACQAQLAQLAASKPIEILATIANCPYSAFLKSYCETGSIDKAGMQTAKAMVVNAYICVVLLPIAAVVCLLIPGAQPGSVLFGALTPIVGALIPVLENLSVGKNPDGTAVANVAAASAKAAAKANGVSDDNVAAMGAALDEAARQAGKTLPAVVGAAASSAARSTFTSEERTRAVKMARLKSAKKKHECAARGGVFDAKAPNGCRVGVRLPGMTSSKGPTMRAPVTRIPSTTRIPSIRAPTSPARNVPTGTPPIVPPDETSAPSSGGGFAAFLEKVPAPVKIAAVVAAIKIGAGALS